MKCLTCGCATTVLSTRGDVRRRRCANGHRVTTRETPIGVLRGFGARAVAEAFARLQRGAQRRQESIARRATIESLLAHGWKPTAIAHRVGVTEARVRQIRSELR